MKILFCNIGWMEKYQGLKGDKIAGGGKHVDSMGWGGEIYNFKPENGMLFGFVEPRGNINLKRLDKNAKDKVTGITIIWTAKKPNSKGTVIVGWYKNATLYSHLQPTPPQFKHKHNSLNLHYYATTKSINGHLLDLFERNFEIPRGKNWMGQRNIWYAEKQQSFIPKVINYIETGYKKRKKGKINGVDAGIRKKVEVAAIKLIIAYFQDLSYDIDIKEKENLGYDLEVKRANTVHYRIEVKGLSGDNINVQLTPNEYQYFSLKKPDYILAVVTKALFKPKIHLFIYDTNTNSWIDLKSDTKLKIIPRESAILRRAT